MIDGVTVPESIQNPHCYARDTIRRIKLLPEVPIGSVWKPKPDGAYTPKGDPGPAIVVLTHDVERGRVQVTPADGTRSRGGRRRSITTDAFVGKHYYVRYEKLAETIEEWSRTCKLPKGGFWGARGQ